MVGYDNLNLLSCDYKESSWKHLLSCVIGWLTRISWITLNTRQLVETVKIQRQLWYWLVCQSVKVETFVFLCQISNIFNPYLIPAPSLSESEINVLKLFCSRLWHFFFHLMMFQLVKTINNFLFNQYEKQKVIDLICIMLLQIVFLLSN